jgi:HSP20 family protein
MLMRTLDMFDDVLRRFETDVTDLFGRNGTWSRTETRLFPPMEVRRTDGELVVRMELPGIDPEKMDVTVDGTTLRVRAERRVSSDDPGNYLRREFAYGVFERQVTLPDGIDPEKMSARYDAGILEVRIPHEDTKAVKIPVEIGSGERKALEAAS